ncbi:MAG: hypothetical protein CMP61_05660 [Flavobacteriales bacterium]|nr:hypothetical protein [Flavobacteriales bacterium]|tara:strand:+ start:35115 stop:36110 length:996 start_codon:yes stop_codon:yes gene_type:complete
MLLAFTLTGQEKHPAVIYMEKVSVFHKDISKRTWNYLSTAANSKRLRKINNKRLKLVKTIADARKEVSKMDSYEGSTVYRDAVVKFLDINETVMNEDFGKLMDMEEVSEQSYDAMEAYFLAKDIANQKLQDAGDELTASEKEFAKNNGITLTESESDLSKKIKAASEVFGYHREIYLIFFKAFKQEAYLLTAMGGKDISAIEQNKNALIKASKEGVDALNKKEAFKGNKLLIYECKKVLDFYIKEAENDIKLLTDFIIENEKVGKAKKALEKNKKRTQKDIDAFNKMVNEVNVKSQKVNQQMEKSNSKRSELLDGWNNSVLQFTSKYVPKN